MANRVYQLRLTAWDLAGRASEIGATFVIDSAGKQAGTIVTNATMMLAGHALALARE